MVFTFGICNITMYTKNNFVKLKLFSICRTCKNSIKNNRGGYLEISALSHKPYLSTYLKYIENKKVVIFLSLFITLGNQFTTNRKHLTQYTAQIKVIDAE